MSRTTAIAIGATLLFLATPLVSIELARESLATGARSEDPLARELRNSSAVARILGEFRANLGDLIVMKTEVYLDSGIRYEPHLDAEAIANSGKVQAKGRPPATGDDAARKFELRLASEKMRESASIRPGEAKTESDHGHDHDHDHDTTGTDAHGPDGDHEHPDTIIPTPERDFRGFLGRLHREVKPWRDPRLPHRHTAGTELLPWYRLATLGDPQNVRGYMIGSWWLKSMKDQKQITEALKFVEEGARNNPRAFQLQLMRGYVLRELKREPEALAAFRRAADMAVAKRPPEGKTGPEWTTYNEEDASAACTMSVLLTRDLKGEREALILGRDYLARARGIGGVPVSVANLEYRLGLKPGAQP